MDDTLLFCEPCLDQLIYLSWVLFWFELSSRLKINLNKSGLIVVGEVANVEEVASLLGCKVGKLPTTYLSPSYFDMMKSEHFKYIYLFIYF